jgi:peptide/nickel transport system ATP-binding protein
VRSYLTGSLEQAAGAQLAARLTVAELIGEPLTSRDRRVNQRALSYRIAGLLDEMQLPLGAAAKYPYELSSGMRQRVALARALVLQPRVFIGDDLYANLDPEVRLAARDALLRRRDEDGMAILMVTNDPVAVDELDADVLVLRGGHPVGFGHGTSDVLWTPDEATRLAS